MEIVYNTSNAYAFMIARGYQVLLRVMIGHIVFDTVRVLPG